MTLTADHSVLGRLLGRFRISTNERSECSTRDTAVLVRFRDLDGYSPSLYSASRLHLSIFTKLLARKSRLLGKPVPFLVYDAIPFLEGLVSSGCRVLEIGGGNSTIWFLRKGAHVTTIETSRDWANVIRTRAHNDTTVHIRSTFSLIRREGAEALEFIKELPDSSLDIVLVDSIPEQIPRGKAMEAARSKLCRGGWMVLDNSDSPAHHDGVALMLDKKRLRFTGYGPMRLRVSQTSFWQM